MAHNRDVPVAYLPNGDYSFFTVPHHGAKLTELSLTSSVAVIFSCHIISFTEYV